MVKISPGTQLTLEEFLALPEGAVNYEFVEGQAVPKVSPKFFHSTLQLTLGSLLRAWCKGKGRVGSEWTILLKRKGEDWAPVPDLTYISYERLPKSWNRNEACPALPELVIEIISPERRLNLSVDPPPDLAIEIDVTSKTQLSAYVALGVPELWCYGEGKLQVFVLRNGEYIEVENSPTFGNLPIIEGILQFLKLSETEGASAARREFRQWVRKVLA